MSLTYTEKNNFESSKIKFNLPFCHVTDSLLEKVEDRMQYPILVQMSEEPDGNKLPFRMFFGSLVNEGEIDCVICQVYARTSITGLAEAIFNCVCLSIIGKDYTEEKQQAVNEEMEKIFEDRMEWLKGRI